MATLAATDKLYADYVNPQWVRLLDVLQMNVPYVGCKGAELFRADGQRVLDFLSGYCVHNTGHTTLILSLHLKKNWTEAGR
jgi:ornithine--oxo-acid transaminase